MSNNAIRSKGTSKRINNASHRAPWSMWCPFLCTMHITSSQSRSQCVSKSHRKVFSSKALEYFFFLDITLEKYLFSEVEWFTITWKMTVAHNGMKSIVQIQATSLSILVSKRTPPDERFLLVSFKVPTKSLIWAASIIIQMTSKSKWESTSRLSRMKG